MHCFCIFTNHNYKFAFMLFFSNSLKKKCKQKIGLQISSYSNKNFYYINGKAKGYKNPNLYVLDTQLYSFKIEI
jgi:hypothetical protein